MPKSKNGNSRNPRACAFQSLVEWEEQLRSKAPTHYARDVFEDQLTIFDLSSADQALARELFFGVVRNRGFLDQLIKTLRRKGSVKLAPRCLLRLGLYQIFFTKVADHAAVNETVTLATKHERGLVNAILRNALRQHDSLLAESKNWSLCDRVSHPKFLVNRWIQHHGEQATQELCEWNNQPPHVYARICDEEVFQTVTLTSNRCNPYRFEPVENFPDFVQLAPGPLPIDLIDNGTIYIQDPSTSISCWLLAPMPGETILDACAAPGGKTSLLHAMCPEGTPIYATDSNPERITRLQENLARLEIEDVQIENIDWATPDPEKLKDLPLFDAILLDVPCSNTGVMRRRVDVRWRLDKKSFSQLSELQSQILTNASNQLKQGGRLVYSTCSIDQEENEQIIEGCGLQIEEIRRSTPWQDNIDGAFAALLRKD